MNHSIFFQLIAALAALVSVGMWLDYYRHIDVFEKERRLPMLVALIIGGLAPFLSLRIYSVIETAGFKENGEFFIDLFYAVFCIGLNEELSKLMAVMVAFFFLKKYLNEPVDYLIYAGMTALGFSLIENYRYFLFHGLTILSTRSFYSALEHIINTSIIVYGIFRFQLFNKGNPLINALIAISIAVASHGLFDFFLTIPRFPQFTSYGSILVYLLGINFWAQMLNNANNFSSFFNYEKVQVSSGIVLRLLTWYAITLMIVFVNNALFTGSTVAVHNFIHSLYSDSLVFFIVIVRVSRFRILQGVYLPVRLQLPFYLTKNFDEDVRIPLFNFKIRVRGENYREHLLTSLINQDVLIVSEQHDVKKKVHAKITRKILLKDDLAYYQVLFYAPKTVTQAYYLLKPVPQHLKVDNLDDQSYELFSFQFPSDIWDEVQLQKISLLLIDRVQVQKFSL